MYVIASLLVLASGLTHAVWNLFTKQSRNKNEFLWLIMALSCAVLLPSTVWELATASIPPKGYGLLLLSFFFQGMYAILLSKTYDSSDLSQVYPIMRGTGTLLIPVIGVVFLQESLSAWRWAGLVCILAGFYKLSGLSIRRSMDPALRKSILLAFSVGLCTTGYVFIDKFNLDYISPLALLEVANLGFMAALTPAVLRSRQLVGEWRSNWPVLILGSVLNPGSYLLFLVAMQFAPIAQISPIREVGIVFATFLGIAVLKEKQGKARIVSSIVIAFGIIVISVLG
ncbi:DMT family transporter [Paenibacillus sacheonensis]|uniref:EamA family transporter n=1 Tax=Paenibacillus sacheonensis TaxID=742054 RepID=A0A7X4YUS9_9BACL|nr:DMT family transporter [Paenibacillus sacheonensis]MBM7568149.1 multidrug transporter EmrE-like cation transporter [Paenibacillus sacheonensis]NBC71849.1 EamA family transporter [Paenibacillus sacheonensis]